MSQQKNAQASVYSSRLYKLMSGLLYAKWHANDRPIGTDICVTDNIDHRVHMQFRKNMEGIYISAVWIFQDDRQFDGFYLKNFETI